MSDQVGNPEDRFSHDEAHMILSPISHYGDGSTTTLSSNKGYLSFRNPKQIYYANALVQNQWYQTFNKDTSQP